MIELENKELIYVVSVEILELTNYNAILQKLTDYIQKTRIFPARIFFIAFKSYRNVPIQDVVELNKKTILMELWIEWFDNESPFNGEDLLLVNESEIKVAGFNFTNMDDMLDYAFEYTLGGQIKVHIQRQYYSEVSSEESQVELLWKGIMIKE